MTAPFWCYAVHSFNDIELSEPEVQRELPVNPRQTVTEIIETSSDDEQTFWHIVFAAYVLYTAAID